MSRGFNRQPRATTFALVARDLTPAVLQVTDWTNHIVDNCLRELQSLNKPFKYMITCIIMQKNGAGLNTSATMFWDPDTDNYCQVKADGLTHMLMAVAAVKRRLAILAHAHNGAMSFSSPSTSRGWAKR